MKRKDFIKRAGTLGLGAGALALIYPTNVEGWVNDNADLRKTVGYADFSNLAPTLTEAVGNSTLETTAKTLSGGINELKKSVSDGKKLLADTITKNGVSTAGDATFKTMADNIDTIASNASSASADSYNKGYAQGVTDADNRANTNSTNYKTGYNAGVADADNRTNVNSANYKAGYSAGASSVSVKKATTTISGGGSPGEHTCVSSTVGLRGHTIVGYGATASTCSGGYSASGSVGIKDLVYDAGNDRFPATLCCQRSQGASATYTISAWYY